MESDDSDKDWYRPEDQEGSDEDEVASKGEVESENESEKEEVVPKKGKKAKPGHREIAAIQTTVPTMGSKSAVEHSKRRERSPKLVPRNLCIYCLR